ncbi:MAG: phosphoenolpyruvate synthase, partial [Calditrichaeota bacterium]
KPILNRAERHKLRVFAAELRSVLPGTPGIKTAGPFDVELGFWKESIWLFQVRPFVENKLARSSAYLKALDSDLPEELQIDLNH